MMHIVRTVYSAFGNDVLTEYNFYKLDQFISRELIQYTQQRLQFAMLKKLTFEHFLYFL